MRNMIIILSASALLSGCYQSRSMRANLEDTVPDLSPDYDGPGDVQRDTYDTWDALDSQDIREGFEDMPEESDESCDPASLVLQPVSFMTEMWPHGPRDCAGADVSEVRVLLFQGSSIILDATSPCLGDTVVVGLVTPGNYELAAIAEGDVTFIFGSSKLQILYPYVPDCSPIYVACRPLALTVTPCMSITISLTLYCNEVFSGCVDCCGGA
jgi:hypothetical protein